MTGMMGVPRTSARELLLARPRRAIARFLARVGLFPAIITALGAGLVVAVAAQWALHRLITTNTAAAQPIDVTKLSLAVVAGVGGIVALVVAYRRQRDIEQGRFVERFGAAAAQLGATDVAVRIAGVYAMAGVADESTGRRQQQCIDVLCGYLRLPYDASHGNSGRTKLVVKTPKGTDGPGDLEEHIEYRQNDKTVRRTIVRVIASHLQRDAEYRWSANDFDFSTAHLEDADFGWATFTGYANFVDVTFTGRANFGAATFTGVADFGVATFTGFANFDAVTFTGFADFGAVTFTGYGNFNDVTFAGSADFEGADFGSATVVTFATPRQWGPPPPRFDWDPSPASKPKNVEPQDWPPTVAAMEA